MPNHPYTYQGDELHVCPQCGGALREGLIFCTACGARVSSRPAKKKLLKSPFTKLFVWMTVGLSVLAAGEAAFLIWYFMYLM